MRESWDGFFLRMAELVSTMSTCARVSVGAVLVRDRRVISTGYNGVPSGDQHCQEYFRDCHGPAPFDEHAMFSQKRELHAEMNAILFAARHGVSVEGTTLYTTISPCDNCAKAILAAGITRVVYAKEYDRGMDGIQFLTAHDVSCEKGY